ncbi:hypothetical protein [Klebsiella phage vB_KpnS-VAC51]|uniref:Uncharacterized protein n=1 Tax=Klebsiella phage vB_KpnS-VAC51 TaxID=2866698 RepID=A0AAE8YIH6_9CAUD|nr:hypothetical protein [Klebsiella phage vB_KpnS-VAC51]
MGLSDDYLKLTDSIQPMLLSKPSHLVQRNRPAVLSNL